MAADAWPGLTASLSHLARANISVTAGLSAPRLTKKGWRELFLLFTLFLFCFILLYDTLDQYWRRWTKGTNHQTSKYYIYYILHKTIEKK